MKETCVSMSGEEEKNLHTPFFDYGLAEKRGLGPCLPLHICRAKAFC